MRGPRIPVRWDRDVRTRAVELLGFDPESPMVRAEVSGILGRGAADGPAARAPSVADLLLGYREVDVGEEAAVSRFEGPTLDGLPRNASEFVVREPARARADGGNPGGETAAEGPRGGRESTDAGDEAPRALLFTLLGIGAVALLGGLAVVVRKRRV
jgi:hypothetical protein